MERISDEKLEVLIDKIQKLETPKQFRGQCIRSNAVQALKELKERREIDNKWISVKDRLPEINVAEGDCSEEVLIVVKGEVISGTRYWIDGLFEDYQDSSFELNEVTHWMHLPKPPKEGDK